MVPYLALTYVNIFIITVLFQDCTVHAEFFQMVAYVSFFSFGWYRTCWVFAWILSSICVNNFIIRAGGQYCIGKNFPSG